jgi:hypothetical protein
MSTDICIYYKNFPDLLFLIPVSLVSEVHENVAGSLYTVLFIITPKISNLTAINHTTISVFSD